MSGASSAKPRRGSIALLVLLVLVGVAAVRVAATYRVFSETADEHHFVAGMEWWDRGEYTYTIFHPPLARILSALPLHLAGVRSHGLPDPLAEKNAILYAAPGYVHNLALARAGVLPFLVLAIVCVWLWARRLAGDGAATAAALLFSTLPPVLAHAGLTTTDMALTATFTLALFAFCLWLEAPTRRRTVLFGIAGGLAVVSKFSVFPLFGASALAILAVRAAVSSGAGGARPVPRFPLFRRILSLALAGSIAALLVWAAYRFSWGALPAVSAPLGRTVLRGPGAVPTSGPRLPAPELWEGLRQIRESVYIRGGHPSYLLGRYSRTGWWYYFPVALAVKTPLPFLLLSAAGAGAAVGRARRDWRAAAPFAAATAVLLTSLFSRTDIGVRHILPIYPLLAITAGCGLTTLWTWPPPKRLLQAGLGALVVWQLADSVRSHPDYLAHFNELAGGHPDRILLDSNLDWGQDLYRLSAELRARHADSVALAYFGNADVSRHGLPPVRPLSPDRPTAGWVAISEMWRKDVAGGGIAYRWLDAYEPVARVGASILLYFIPEPGPRSDAPALKTVVLSPSSTNPGVEHDETRFGGAP